jgi:hypothetical protein
MAILSKATRNSKISIAEIFGNLSRVYYRVFGSSLSSGLPSLVIINTRYIAKCLEGGSPSLTKSSVRIYLSFSVQLSALKLKCSIIKSFGSMPFDSLLQEGNGPLGREVVVSGNSGSCDG